jgi:outer membrane protein OmpA-like peptidoglycan-associated protein
MLNGDYCIGTHIAYIRVRLIEAGKGPAGRNSMKKATIRFMSLALAGMLFSTVSFAQDKADANQMKFAAGQKAKVSGQIIRMEPESFVVQSMAGGEAQVKVTAATVIKEKKLNLFRGAKAYQPSQLVRGLEVDVEGLGDGSGAIAARDIRFTQTELLVANSVERRVTPVEGRLTDTEVRLTRSEDNARHLSGQVDEVRDLANSARAGAKAAEEGATAALAGVDAANGRITSVDQTTNSRITAVDDFQIQNTVAIRFKIGSAVLSPEAQGTLEQLVKDAQTKRGYVVEVSGFASADGSANYNRMLSKSRADAVVQYLADNQIPLRRIVTPFGYGVKMPVGDNQTRAGREENRRVEVRVLVSKGLAESEPQGIATSRNQK